MADKLIEVVDGCFAYDQTDILDSINVTLGAGEILCLLGPNGCGKTTLLNCMLGINKLNRGLIKINAQDIRTLKPSEVARCIAYVPQSSEKSFPYTVMDIVLMGRTAHIGAFSSPDEKDYRIAEEALEQVGIDHLKDRIYTNLSGGESQLVMVARALAQQTEVIVMDEPTANLDFKNELVILETVVRLVREKKISFVMATHFPNHTYYFENQQMNVSVAMFNDGRIDLMGRPTDVLTEDNIKAIYKIDSKRLSYAEADRNELKYIIPLNTCFDKNREVT